MGIDAEQLDKEADADFARMMGQAEPAEAPTQAPAPAEDVPPPPAAEPEPSQEAPAPTGSEDWQDKFNKAEESRKNAHALMTQATQKAADLERSNQEMQQQLGQLQMQVNQLSQQPPAQAAPSQPDTDQFSELREDYEELNPVFNQLDEATRRNQALEQRLAAIEQARQQQEQISEAEQFWNEVRQVHSDVDQIAASPDFQGWFARQSPGIQQMSKVSPEGAAHVMTLYKQAGTHSPHPNAAGTATVRTASADTDATYYSGWTSANDTGPDRRFAPEGIRGKRSEVRQDAGTVDKAGRSALILNRKIQRT